MISRSLEHLHPSLAASWQRAQKQWEATYPARPQPFITCTYRSHAAQAALFAQGREPLATVNQLRAAAQLAPITATENRKRITNARPGQSAHNTSPSSAFDVAFIKDDRKTLDWSPELFAALAALMPDVEWGGNWKKFKDRPHFQRFNWNR